MSDLYERSPYVRVHPQRPVSEGFVNQLQVMIRQRAADMKQTLGKVDNAGIVRGLTDLAFHIGEVDVRDARLWALSLSMNLESPGNPTFGAQLNRVVGAVDGRSNPDQALTDMASVATEDSIATLRTKVAFAEMRLGPLMETNAELSERAGRADALEGELEMERAAHAREISMLLKHATLQPDSEDLPENIFRHGSGFRFKARGVNNGRPGPTRKTIAEAVHDLDEATAESAVAA